MGYYSLNNGKIGKVSSIPLEMRSSFSFKTAITLPSEIDNDSSIYFDVMEKLFNATDPLPEGKMPSIKMSWVPDGLSKQIETNLEPQELLSALWSSQLITHDEMINAYKELDLSPQGRDKGNDLRPSETPETQNSSWLPSFSL